jgi:hypothetical protein
VRLPDVWDFLVKLKRMMSYCYLLIADRTNWRRRAELIEIITAWCVADFYHVIGLFLLIELTTETDLWETRDLVVRTTDNTNNSFVFDLRFENLKTSNRKSSSWLHDKGLIVINIEHSRSDKSFRNKMDLSIKFL